MLLARRTKKTAANTIRHCNGRRATLLCLSIARLLRIEMILTRLTRNKLAVASDLYAFCI
jgi:hypothetical protein